MRRTKGGCASGPASASREQLERLVAAGMDVARLNFSHGTHAEHVAVIALIRAGEARWGRPVAILQDLQGPKIRLGTFGAAGGVRVDLEPGHEFTLCASPVAGRAERASVTHPGYLRELRPGDQVWMDDGMIQLRVEETSAEAVRCRVLVGGRVSDHKGVSFPRVGLPMSCLTDKDREDLRFGIAHGVDFVAVSFVRSAADLEEVRAFLRAQGAALPLVAKLERHDMLANLGEILAQVDAVMVARGDLGVDVPLEDVPHIQKEIIRQARAEVSDVATAIFDGTDAIMLSAETATGRYPAEAVEVMARIAERAERAVLGGEPRRRSDRRAGFPEAIADAAASAAHTLDARAIVAFTESGFSARLISGERPDVPIIALTPSPEVRRRLALSWGVSSRLIRKVETTDAMLEEVEATLLGDGTVRPGDGLVIISGSPMWVSGTTNLMQLHHVGARH